MRRSLGQRDGGTIAFVLLLLLAMEVLAQAALVAAMGELSATRGGVAYLQARAAAEGGVRAVLAAPLGQSIPDPSVGERVVVLEARRGRVQVRVSAERVSREAWVLEGVARVDGRPGQVSRRRWAWALDPLQRVGTTGAVVRTGRPGSEAARIRIDPEILRPDDRIIAQCSRWFGALDSLLASRVVPPVLYDPTAGSVPRLGLMTMPTLLPLAPQLQQDSVDPRPRRRLGRCDGDAPDNWGDPTQEGGECRDHYMMRGREGDLRMVGGVGQGVLTVTGDLTLDGAAHFAGVVLVGGTLRVRGGARLEGLVQAGQGVEVDGASTIVGSACAAARALHANRASLRRFVAFADWGWLGPN